MSADDTYVIRYEPDQDLPYVVLWRQNYWDYDHPTLPKDWRLQTLSEAQRVADSLNREYPAEYGVHVEDNVPLPEVRPPDEEPSIWLMESRFDELIDLIDDLRSAAYEAGTRGHGLTMIDRDTVNKMRVLCGLEKE